VLCFFFCTPRAACVRARRCCCRPLPSIWHLTTPAACQVLEALRRALGVFFSAGLELVLTARAWRGFASNGFLLPFDKRQIPDSCSAASFFLLFALFLRARGYSPAVGSVLPILAADERVVCGITSSCAEYSGGACFFIARFRSSLSARFSRVSQAFALIGPFVVFWCAHLVYLLVSSAHSSGRIFWRLPQHCGSGTRSCTLLIPASWYSWLDFFH
jgi:hypothetical protein